MQTLLRIAKKEEEKVKCSSQQSPCLPFPFLLSDFWLFGITPSFYFCLKMHLDTKCYDMPPGNSITREICYSSNSHKWGALNAKKIFKLKTEEFFLRFNCLFIWPFHLYNGKFKEKPSNTYSALYSMGLCPLLFLFAVIFMSFFELTQLTNFLMLFRSSQNYKPNGVTPIGIGP